MCIEKISSPRGDFFVVLAYAKIGEFSTYEAKNTRRKMQK